MEINYSIDELAALREVVAKNQCGLLHCGLEDWKLHDGFAELVIRSWSPVYNLHRFLTTTDSDTLPLRLEKDGDYVRTTQKDVLYPRAECWVPFANARVCVDVDGYLFIAVDVGSTVVELNSDEFQDMLD